MINNNGLLPKHIKADNEHKLEEILFNIALETKKDVHVITIYPKGSSVVAWIKLETKHLAMAPKEPVKKKAAKKTKKVSRK